MPLKLEEIALKDLIRHPRIVVLYACFLGLGWLGDRLIPLLGERFMPDDAHLELERCHLKNDRAWHEKDSVQRSKDLLYEQMIAELQHKDAIIKTTDSIINRLTIPAKAILNNKNNGNNDQ